MQGHLVGPIISISLDAYQYYFKTSVCPRSFAHLYMLIIRKLGKTSWTYSRSIFRFCFRSEKVLMQNKTIVRMCVVANLWFLTCSRYYNKLFKHLWPVQGIFVGFISDVRMGNTRENTQNKLFCQTINLDELALGMKRWHEVHFLSLKNIFCQI